MIYDKVNFPPLTLIKKANEKEKEELKEELKEDIDVSTKYDIKEKEIENSDKLLNKHYLGIKVKQRSYLTNDYCIIENNNENYVVMRIRTIHNESIKWLPLVFDFEYLELIKNFNDGNWNITNNYVIFSKKNGKTMFYLHNIIMNIIPDGPGKSSCDHLNRMTLDNRKSNLCIKTQSEQNNNQKTRKCSSKNLDKLPEPYRTYYLESRPKFIYWLYDKTHGHRIIAGPIPNMKEKKFSSKDPQQIPILMKKAEDYLIEYAQKNDIPFDQITSNLDPKSNQLKREYIQIIMKASKILQIDLL